ncbi:hypothetical protein GGI08_007209 [Coemansia sp. S2]|nr:hypothetical protein GGI08_007209 [Coemansia sp. S2]KAJ2068377.1 hypothetical protein GGH13_004937 [Coemansia sp. S155-1]
MSASQSIVLQVQNIGLQGVGQLESVAHAINSRALSIAHVLTGGSLANPLANQLLFPFTNYPGFIHEAERAIENLQLLVNSDLSYAKEQLQLFTSIAIQDVTAVTADIRKLLTSLYAFSQEAVDIILTSPLLTALTLVNPALVVATMLAAADPIQLLTNYPNWKDQFSARESSMISNYKDIYSFVSTGLPMVESGVLGFLGGLSNVGRAAESEHDDVALDEINNMLRAYTALINLGADKRHIPLLASSVKPQDAWMSVAYHRWMSPTHASSGAESAVDAAPSSTQHAFSAEGTAPASPIPTLHSS